MHQDEALARFTNLSHLRQGGFSLKGDDVAGQGKRSGRACPRFLGGRYGQTKFSFKHQSTPLADLGKGTIGGQPPEEARWRLAESRLSG